MGLLTTIRQVVAGDDCRQRGGVVKLTDTTFFQLTSCVALADGSAGGGGGWINWDGGGKRRALGRLMQIEHVLFGLFNFASRSMFAH